MSDAASEKWARALIETLTINIGTSIKAALLILLLPALFNLHLAFTMETFFEAYIFCSFFTPSNFFPPCYFHQLWKIVDDKKRRLEI